MAELMTNAAERWAELESRISAELSDAFERFDATSSEEWDSVAYNDLWEAVKEVGRVHRRIHPQIVAVVEAAERVASWDDIHAWSRDGEPALPELSVPLAALDEALPDAS
jgi:hypothetical protein